MKQGQRLNPFSIADTDQIRQLAQNRMTDTQIVTFLKRMRKVDITAEEVRQICTEMRVFVRRSA